MAQEEVSLGWRKEGSDTKIDMVVFYIWNVNRKSSVVKPCDWDYIYNLLHN